MLMPVVYYIASVIFQIIAIAFFKEKAYLPAAIAFVCSFHPIAAASVQMIQVALIALITGFCFGRISVPDLREQLAHAEQLVNSLKAFVTVAKTDRTRSAAVDFVDQEIKEYERKYKNEQ